MLVTVRVFPALSVAVTVNERVPGVLVSIPAAWHEATPEVASVQVHDGLAGYPWRYVGAVTVIAGWTVSTLSGIEVAPVGADDAGIVGHPVEQRCSCPGC